MFRRARGITYSLRSIFLRTSSIFVDRWFSYSVCVALGRVNATRWSLRPGLRLTIVSAVCATSYKRERGRARARTLIFLSRGPYEGRTVALFSTRAFAIDGEPDISRSRIRNLIAAFRPPIRIPRNPSDEANPLLFYDGPRAPRSSQRDTYIDSWKSSRRRRGELPGPEEKGERKEEPRTTKPLKLPGERSSLEYFPRFLPLSSLFLLRSFVRSRACAYVCGVRVCSSLFSPPLVPLRKTDLNDCPDGRCRSSGIERTTVLLDAAVWLHSWLYYYDNRRSNLPLARSSYSERWVSCTEYLRRLINPMRSGCHSLINSNIFERQKERLSSVNPPLNVKYYDINFIGSLRSNGTR